MLRKYDINYDDAMALANSRKGYWRISHSEIIHRAITKAKLIKWGLEDTATLYEKRHLKDLTTKYVNRMFGGVRGRLVTYSIFNDAKFYRT